jgi:hypothetical protein
MGQDGGCDESRTLDLYISLCNDLTKLRNELTEETNALLRACWELTEVLFRICWSTKEEKETETELLKSAEQTCWKLCELFQRESRLVRPKRGTYVSTKFFLQSQVLTGQFFMGSRRVVPVPSFFLQYLHSYA